MVNTPACHAGDRGFESRRFRHFFVVFWGVAKSVRHRTLTPACPGSSPGTPAIAQIAQSVEQRTENPRVAGSIPALGTTGPHRLAA